MKFIEWIMNHTHWMTHSVTDLNWMSKSWFTISNSLHYLHLIYNLQLHDISTTTELVLSKLLSSWVAYLVVS